MRVKHENFERYFRILSYSVAVCGLFALYFSGGVGILVAVVFISVLLLAAFLEDSKWQISERAGVILTILIVPAFFIEWRFQLIGAGTGDTVFAGGLARLILFLCAIKLLQKKSDRDWIFIYIIAFFEVLLAAGLTISPLFFLTLVGYLIAALSAIIAFEIRKTARDVAQKTSSEMDRDTTKPGKPVIRRNQITRLPFVTAGLLTIIVLLAIPTFFVLPRVGGAGLGTNLAGGKTISGFSDAVRLGEIGRLKLSEETVMRVRIDGDGGTTASRRFYWRGVALDTFDNRIWSKSRENRIDRVIKGSNGFFSLNFAERIGKSAVQTFYLEPIGSSTVFSMARPISLRGNFDIVRKSADDSLKANGVGFERVNYEIRSDSFEPVTRNLRADRGLLTEKSAHYLQLPENMDRRISDLASSVVKSAGADNVYDKAKSIETFLQTEFRYSLDMKAGGEQPVSDFLFNVRSGHCEYFSTAMAVMLRSQGIATRVVNGFQQGEFNETAGIFVVKQRDAHSWVEVYFPDSRSWVIFDPTPGEGQSNYAESKSFVGTIGKYLEALEAVWIQYFVSYDSQGQQSMFQSAQNGFAQYRESASGWFETLTKSVSEWWHEIRGDKGFEARIRAAAFGFAYAAGIVIGLVFLIWIGRRIARFGVWGSFGSWLKRKNDVTIVEFYERMQKLLAKRGYIRPDHQTPIEFAFALGIPEAVMITEKYNRVRFGEKDLSEIEAREIDKWLVKLDASNRNGRSEESGA